LLLGGVRGRPYNPAVQTRGQSGAGCVAITATVPVEVILAAGWRPMDLNNVFIGSPDPGAWVRAAEAAGLPVSCCAWIRGIYTAVQRTNPELIVAVTQGDCSNTHALMEIFRSEGRRVIDFAYPYPRDRGRLAEAVERFAADLGTTMAAAEDWRRRLRPVRRTVERIDELTWRTGQVSGAENHRWLVGCSDFEGDPDAYSAAAAAFLAAAETRPPQRPRHRLGVAGVPPIVSDLHETCRRSGAPVVFNEFQRQFSMPGEPADLIEQYLAYTYPYDVFGRIDDIRREAARRGIGGLIHYVQSFCFRQIQDKLLRARGGLPVLTLEADRPGALDAAARTRIEAFVEMLQSSELRVES
jgi:benzoyl-CoA reductase/2-hydroxyglutaryl-CoA dehydratase subunit BcrC/BadD/HgdB